MNKKKIIALSLSLIMLVSAIFALTIPAGAASGVNEQSGFYVRAEKDASTYAYSIAIIGDTQSLSDSDYDNRNDTNYVKRMDTLYSWIQDNAESKKIGLVMGLGDIVENWHNPLDYPTYEGTALGNQSIWEWENAARVFNTYLDGENGVKVPYTLVRGNHDSANAYNAFIASENMATYRGQFDSENAGFYVDSKGVTKYDNSYMKLTIGTTKWLAITLDWGITERELDWAGDLIANNPDHRVILTMHCYLYHDKTIDGEGDSADTARPNINWDYTTDMRADNKTEENPEGPVYNPDGIWERLVSRYSNIELVLSGHTPNGAPQMSQLVGDNGNTVTQLLIDPQSMDLAANNTSGCGMVAMLYFNEDGTLADSQWDEETIDLEWYSTIKKKHYKETNQFTIDVNLYDGGIKTENYGIIPAEYADTEKYPFVTFGHDTDIDEYFFLGAYSTWSDESTGAYPALSVISGAAKKVHAYVLLRRDYTSTVTSTYPLGKLTLKEVNLDLNGFTITTGDKNFFNTNLSTAGTNNTLNVFGKEGSTFLNASTYRPFISLGATTSGNGASFTYNFEGITFGFAAGTNSNSTTLIAQTFNMGSSNNSPVTISKNLNFNNCTFDLKTNRTSSAVTLFQLDELVGSGYNVSAANVNISASTILADDLSKVVICNKNDTDSFSAEFTDGGVYTEYGMIPSDKSNATTYPFVAFQNGSYYKAYENWYNFLKDLSANTIKIETQLLVRRDYTVDSTSGDVKTNNCDRNLNLLKAHLTIDLGGNTVTKGNSAFLQGMGNGNDISISIKNGTLHSSGGTMIYFNNTGAKSYKETFTFVFDNVDFTSASNLEVPFVDAYDGGDNTTTGAKDAGTFVNLTFNNCTFDINGCTNTKLRLFDTADTNNRVDFNITFNGGALKADYNSMKVATIVTYDVNSEGGFVDTFNFGEYNGANMKFIASDTVYPTLAIKTGNGKIAVPLNPVKNNTIITYTFEEVDSLESETKYGNIPQEYPVERYPFALFANGKFVKAYASWYQFMDQGSSATDYTAADSPVLLLRRDYSTSECSKSSQGLYTFKGTFVLDLDGKIMTRGSNHMFQAYGKSTSTTSTESSVIVKNGVILTTSNPVVIFNNSGNEGNNAIFNITFEDVTFAIAKGYTPSDLIVSNYTGGKYGSIGNIVFDNCTIDLTTNASVGSTAPSSKLTIFDLASDSGKNFTSITFIGGKIIANSLSNITFVELGQSGTDKAGNARSDSFEFVKAEGENYTMLVLPKGVSAPDTEYNELKFVKISEDNANAVYRLRPVEIADVDYAPKMSITLDSDLVVNVYIPVSGTQKFTFNGEIYENLAAAGLEVVALEDGSYYRVNAKLSAKEAAKELKLAVTVDFGEKTAEGTFTFSIPKYATKVLSSDASDTEKTLVKDVLAYINSAYLYFGGATVGAIDEILGTYKGTLDTTTPETNATVGLKGATLVLEATPALRFYLADNADKTAYKFYVGNSEVAATEGTDKIGAYLEVSLYAYKMCETVTYKINGVVSGSYHIGEYYEYAKTLENANLTALVENFWIYCQSAKAYKAAYTA